MLELGLGNGRTYDHLRGRLSGRDIIAFDRQLAAHPDCVPPAEFLILGELRETLPPLAARIGKSAALIHADLGSGDAAANQRLAMEIAPLIDRLAAPGGIVLSDQALTAPRLVAANLPENVAAGRYFLYRAAV